MGIAAVKTHIAISVQPTKHVQRMVGDRLQKVKSLATPLPPRWRSYYCTVDPVAGGMLLQCGVVWE
jgi:hypothetical protein